MSSQWLFGACNTGFKCSMKVWSRTKVEGRENIPASGPLIVASNHLSTIDPAIVASVLPMPPVFMGKKELFKNPITRTLLLGYGAYPVDRNAGDMRALSWAIHRLREGRTLVLFPEGTRSRGQGLLKAQVGAALLATGTGSAILPVALTGSEPLQNLAKVFAPRARMTIKVGKPFRILVDGGRPDREQLEKATTEIMARIAHMLPAKYRGVYADVADMPYEITGDTRPSEPRPAAA